MTKSLKAVVFDLYDTLIYLADRPDPYRRLFNELKVTDIAYAIRAANTQPAENFERLAALLDPTKRIDAQSYHEDLRRELASATLFPETIEVLTRLRGDGYRTGLISNVSSPHKEPFFRLGLEPLFDKIIFSSDIGYLKPDREIYERMINQLGIAPWEALMTGDSVECDFHGPRAVGMNTVLLDRNDSHQESPKIKTLDEVFVHLS